MPNNKDLEDEKRRKELLLERLQEDDVEATIKEKCEFFKKWRTFSFLILLIFLSGIAYTLVILLRHNLLYTRVLEYNMRDINSFFATTGLVGFAGGVTRQFYNLFQANWQVDTLDQDLKIEPFLGQPDPLNYSKIQNFINSSLTNILFIRLFYIPLIGSLVAVFLTLAIYQLDAGLPRIIIIGFPSGIVAKDLVLKLIRTAKDRLPLPF